MNALEKVISAIIAALIMFIVTAAYFNIKRDSIVQVNVETATARLAERVSVQGYITREMYEDYIKQLGNTGKLYTIGLEHQLAAFEPEYKFRTPGEVTQEDENSWSGTNVLHQGTVSTTIPEITDPVSPLPLNTETNATVLAAAHDTPASSTHEHTDACYNGMKHTHTGSSSTGGGCYTYASHVHNSSCYQDWYCGGVWTGAWNSEYIAFQKCSFCGYDSGGSATQTSASGVPPAWTWMCQSCGEENSTPFQFNRIVGNWQGNCTKCSHGIAATISMEGVIHGAVRELICTKTGSYELNCDKTDGHYYNGDTEVFSICSQQVSGIVPTHSLQTVAIGDPLITTVVVTHADGSTTTKACTTTFSTAVSGLNRTAALTYTYTVDGVTYTKNCTITVNVVPRSKTCAKGHNYNLNNDGTDPGCPFCRCLLSSLSIFSPSSGSLRMYHNGGGLIVQGVSLLAVYMDGHSEHVYDGFADNLDADYVGTQTVTIGYKGITISLQVEVLRNRKQCSVCGLYYDLLPDDTDGGCPYCKARVPIFTGNIMKYTAATYRDVIITELYEGGGTYYFQKEDTFTVSAVSRNRTDFLSLFGNLFSLKIRAGSSYIVKDEMKP